MSVLRVLSIILGVIVIVLVAAWLKLRGPDIPYETLESKYTNAASHFVDLPGDIHLHYQDDGSPTAPVIVLVHGFGDSFTSWEGWVRDLKDQFRLISIDLPGHGLTRAPD